MNYRMLFAFCFVTSIGYAAPAEHLTVHRAIIKTRAAIANGLGRAVGHLEMVGLKYPAPKYQTEVSPSLTRGSRLKPDDIVSLKARGFSTIVALTKESHSDAKVAKEVGLNYLNIPILDNTAPTTKQVQEFLTTVQTAAHDGPVYVHCEQGVGRTGIMVAAYRMAFENWSAPQALKEAEAYGLKLPVQREFIRKLWGEIHSGEVQVDRDALKGSVVKN